MHGLPIVYFHQLSPNSRKTVEHIFDRHTRRGIAGLPSHLWTVTGVVLRSP